MSDDVDTQEQDACEMAIERAAEPALPVGFNPAHQPGQQYPSAPALQHPQTPAPGQRLTTLPDVPCMRTPRCSGSEGHLGACAPVDDLVGRKAQQVYDALTPNERQIAMDRVPTTAERHVESEDGALTVRRRVTIPQMPASYNETEELRRALRVGVSAGELWADLRHETLGEMTYNVQGVHAAVMNAEGFNRQALELVVRAVGRVADWLKTFELIAREAEAAKAWRVMAVVSGALVAGPFTSEWDSAVDWCLAFWGQR